MPAKKRKQQTVYLPSLIWLGFNEDVSHSGRALSTLSYDDVLDLTYVNGVWEYQPCSSVSA